MIYSCEGIVLKNHKLGEADLVVTLMLETGEIMGLRLHGIRNSRNRSQLLGEVGCRLKVAYYKAAPEALASLKEGVVLDRYDVFKDSYGHMLFLSYLLEIAESGARGQPMKSAFELLRRGLDYLKVALPELTPNEQRLFLSFFRLRMLFLAGLAGEVLHCSECSQSVEKGAKWALPDVRFECAECNADATALDAALAGWVHLATQLRFSDWLRRWKVGSDETIIQTMDMNSRKCFEAYTGSKSLSESELYRILCT